MTPLGILGNPMLRASDADRGRGRKPPAWPSIASASDQPSRRSGRLPLAVAVALVIAGLVVVITAQNAVIHFLAAKLADAEARAEAAEAQLAELTEPNH